MDFLTLNFGQLLYLLDDELKNTIRNFEKQNKQIISAQYGKLFNQTCLNEELYPAYIYIHTYTCCWYINANYLAVLLCYIIALCFDSCVSLIVPVWCKALLKYLCCV